MSNRSPIIENIEGLKQSIPSHVTLVAVSKTKPIEDLQIAYDHGVRDFGENKVQELLAKHEALPKDIRWHMIGHLQRNKVASLIDKVHLIHGIDSMRLLKEINKRALEKNIAVDGLIQVHIAQEDTKFGFDHHEVKSLFSDGTLNDMEGVRIRGLMGMASFVSDEKVIKQEFESLHNLFQELKSDHLSDEFDTISMGMSGDFGVAIESGSTMVRVGSAIFGHRH